MNARYGVLTQGMRTVIIDKRPSYETDKPIVLLGPTPFKDRLQAESADLLFGSGRGTPNKADGWMEHPHASRYDAIDFNPSLPPGDNGPIWNTWRGFSVEPQRGDWSILIEHIRENIAAGNIERFEWIMNWLALGVQRPSDIIGTAPVLYGPQGVGKTLLAELYGRLWQPHNVTLTNPKHVRGSFNEFLLGCRFVFLDESFFGGDRGGAGVMKTQLTDEFLMIEPRE